MRFLPVLLASGVVAMTKNECFSSHGAGLAAFSGCAQRADLAECFVGLAGTADTDVEQCFVQAGCTPDDAALEARLTLDRCDEWVRAHELRRRAPSADFAQVTVPPVFARQNTIRECFMTSFVETSVCPVETNNGAVTTRDCTTTSIARSSCSPGLTCSLDSQGEDVCMELQNALDTAGIIIAIVFGVAIASAIATITYLCCKDRRENKRLTAKAEATALARAATKKQRAADVRAPLMSEQAAPGPSGNADPFGDRHHS